MADSKISELPAGDALTGAELVPVVQDGVTIQTTAQDIADLAGGPTDGDKGDITVAGGVWTIDAGAVTVAKVVAALKDCSLPGLIRTPAVETLTIDQKAPFAYTITEFAAKLVSGTCTARLLINGTPVTGSSTGFSNVEAAGTCTAANTVAAGDTVAIEWTAVSSPVDFAYTVKAALS